MTPKATLISTLEALGFVSGSTLFLQGSLGSRDYPASFVTFWTDATDDTAIYDNDTKSYTWSFSVIYYSSSAANTNTVPETIRAALKTAGFVPQGKGRDIPSDEPTHTGWAQNYLFTEYE